MWGSQQQLGLSAEGIFPRGGTRSFWIVKKCTLFYFEINTRIFLRGGIQSSWIFQKRTPNYSAAKFYLLKTIFTSATLMSPELSMNTFHSWISYSRRSFLPAVNFFLIHRIDKRNIKTCIIDSDIVLLQHNELFCKALNIGGWKIIWSQSRVSPAVQKPCGRLGCRKDSRWGQTRKHIAGNIHATSWSNSGNRRTHSLKMGRVECLHKIPK